MTPIETAALQQSAESAKGFLNKIFGPALEEYGQIFQDNIKVRRFKNQIKNLEKVKAIVEKENLSIKQVNLKVLVPYLENVSLEEEESLQNKWANLFTNYIDAEVNLTSTVYPAVLAQLSSFDLEILEYMLPFDKGVDLHRRHSVGDRDISYLHLSNLIRLGLIEEVKSYYTKTNSTWDDEPVHLSIMENNGADYVVTAFGAEFIDACKR